MIRVPPALRHRRFTLLWLGLMISVAGSQMTVAALFWHIRSLTGTPQPIALGAIGIVRFLPMIIFSLVGGAIADVVNRRRMLFITQTSLAMISLTFALLTWSGQISLWHIYVLTALQAVASAFDLPSRQALVPNLVPPRDLPNAFSLTSIAFQVGTIGGPALSGLVIAYLGQGYAYLFDAFSFLAVILALILMGPVNQEAAPGLQRNGETQSGRRSVVSLPAILEGIRFIRTHPIILSTMFVDFIATFFSSANTLMPIIAKDVLHVGALQYGSLSSAQSIGAVLAALIVSQMSGISRQGPVFLFSVFVFGLATAIFGLVRSFPLAMLALMFVGAADSVSTIIRNTIRQLQTPDYVRGRMTSINQIFFLGGPQLGEVEAGVVAQIFSTPFAVVSGGIGCIVALGVIIGIWPQLLRFNGDEPVGAETPAS